MYVPIPLQLLTSIVNLLKCRINRDNLIIVQVIVKRLIGKV